VASLLTTNQKLLRELDVLPIEVILPAKESHLATVQVTSPMVDRIKECQKGEPKLMKLSKRVDEVMGPEFSLRKGVLWFWDHLCVPKIL